MDCCRKKVRDEQEVKQLLNRLKRIEGQIRGLQKLVETDTYCPDILVQANAASAALEGFKKELLSSHIKSCVMDDIREGNEEAADELIDLLYKLMR
ncbi:MAG: metal-sensing transcriptional repressor [Erysipelotrichaceae bacterium]|nr:metal-sensing transcriptional repressor [Erysipelotrichaceae bacterium]